MYVDDFKMAGVRENLGPMWKSLGQHLKLDPPTEYDGGTYLGQTQNEVEIPSHLIEEQSERWKELFQDDRGGKVLDPDVVTKAFQHRTAVETKKQQEEENAKDLPQEDIGHLLEPLKCGSIPEPESKPKAKAKPKKSVAPQVILKKDEDKNEENFKATASKWSPQKVRDWQYDMCGHSAGVVEYPIHS